jgi:hypothetical protein
MIAWRITNGPRQYGPDNGSDSAIGWKWEIERNGERRTIKVEKSEDAAAYPSIAEEARLAIQTRGRSAIETILDADDPPPLLIISDHGVHWAT